MIFLQVNEHLSSTTDRYFGSGTGDGGFARTLLHLRPTVRVGEGAVTQNCTSAPLSLDGAPYERGRCSLRTKVRLPHSCFLWSACRDPTGPTATATARSRFRPVDASRQTRSGAARDAMLRTSRRSLANTKWSDLACCIGSLAKCSGAMMSLTNAELRHKNGKTRDGCEGGGQGGSCPIHPGRGGATSDEQCSELHVRGGHD